MSDRRYRQRGYQDDDGSREERRPGKPPPPREKREGPRGRGLGAPTATVFRCAVCGRKQPAPGVAAVAATCLQCGTDLHTCTHCLHFDTSASNECRQPVVARVAKKSKRNECELFEPKQAAEFAADQQRPADARAAFDSLFKF
jgi:hypothetical protein